MVRALPPPDPSMEIFCGGAWSETGTCPLAANGHGEMGHSTERERAQRADVGVDCMAYGGCAHDVEVPSLAGSLDRPGREPCDPLLLVPALGVHPRRERPVSVQRMQVPEVPPDGPRHPDPRRLKSAGSLDRRRRALSRFTIPQATYGLSMTSRREPSSLPVKPPQSMPRAARSSQGWGRGKLGPNLS